MTKFNQFVQKKREGGLSTASTSDLKSELSKREKSPNIFPLDVFSDKIKPFIESLHNGYDIPRSFIGLTLISAYSTAIGTSYIITTNGHDGFYLPVWGCLIGMSSSGKTLVFNQIYEPLLAIQNKMDDDWNELTKGMPESQIKEQKLNTVVYRDAHIPTLVRYVMPDNPKGTAKFSDELIEWINGMNQLSKKEGTDEQFWLSSWNCTSYSGIRAGKAKFVIPRPFINIIGGIQRKKLPKLFANDRDSTGFVYRILFAKSEEEKIAEADPEYNIPEQWRNVHSDSLNRLYNNLEVDDQTIAKKCILTPEAVKIYRFWTSHVISQINKMQDLDEKEVHSGIFGKIKEYALRFVAILHLSDKALSLNYDHHTSWRQEEFVDKAVMERAIKLAEYFYCTAVETYESVSTTIVAPKEVLYASTLMKMGKTEREIAQFLWQDNTDAAKKRMNRQLKKWIKDYPRVFNSVAK